jgi:CheY-like chemotaxis protein
MESIGRLAGGIAHDFNNMLSAIRGYADLIESDLRSNTRETIDFDDLGRSAEAITSAADRAAGLTAQLLAFARQQVLQPHVIDLREVALGVEPMLRRLIGERIRLAMALDPATGRLRGDPAQIDQIVINLVINARDALPDGGTITVETANHTIGEAYAIEHFDVPPGQYVMLAVGDDGVGMDVETRQHIFEPFFTTKEVGKGTGLGLATIFGIVRQSGGHIWLYSEPGRGTIFKLYFPRVDELVDQPEGTAPPTSAKGSGRLLVVEDEDQVRDLIVRVLERAGYSITTAADGQAALKLLETDHASIRAIVSDVVMPGMTGTELADIVLDRFPDTGVVLLSGYTAETLDLADVLTRGAYFLGKPFSADQLSRAVAASLRAGRLSS